MVDARISEDGESCESEAGPEGGSRVSAGICFEQIVSLCSGFYVGVQRDQNVLRLLSNCF